MDAPTLRWTMATDDDWTPKVDEMMTALARGSEDYSAGVVGSSGRDDAGRLTFLASVCHRWRDPNHEEDGAEYVGFWIDLSDTEAASPVWGSIDVEDLA